MPDTSTRPSRETSTDLVDTLCLSMVSGIGPQLFRQLIDEFGSPCDVLDANAERLSELPGIGPSLARRITTARTEFDAGEEIDRCREHGIQVIPRTDDCYPSRLVEIFDPPSVLFCRGQICPADDLAIGVVGTRHATRYGLQQAERLARGLALSGFTVVSGMARGIDAAAHRGALDAGGRTIAVLGSGLLNLYPPEHSELAQEISQHGSVVSEFCALEPPKSNSFPRRNRIISGLSLGLVVVEAAARSGALISAHHAMEQNREVFAVPGRVDNRVSSGCHQLIRDGAKLVESVDDILEELGPVSSPIEHSQGELLRSPAELQLNEQELSILRNIQSDATEIDDIVEGSGLPVHRVLSTLSVLEVRRLVRRVTGTSWVRI